MEYKKLLELSSKLLYEELVRLKRDDEKTMKEYSLTKEEYYEILPGRKPEILAYERAKDIYQINAKEFGIEPQEFATTEEILCANDKIVNELYLQRKKEYDSMTPKERIEKMLRDGCRRCMFGEWFDYDQECTLCDECPENILEPYIGELNGVKTVRKTWCPEFKWS